MRRRELLLIATAMLGAPTVRAQQTAIPIIGWLSSLSPDRAEPFLAAFRQGLRETGYVEGHNVTVEYRWAEGNYDRLPTLAVELVGRRVDVIATSGGDPSALAAKKATSTIPIVFVVGADPVTDGLVGSFARPGGNLTGFSILNVELTPKRLELLCELIPDAKVIAFLVNPNSPQTEPVIQDMQEAARAKGVSLPVLNARNEVEIDAAFTSLTRLQANGMVVQGDPVFSDHREQLIILAVRHMARGSGRPGGAHWLCAGDSRARIGTLCRSGDLCAPSVRRGRRSDQLWVQPHDCPSWDWHIRRKNPRRRQSRRFAYSAADDLRIGR